MMLDSQDASQVLTNDPAFEPMERRQVAKKNLRGKGGALMASSAMIAAAAALTIGGEAVAQGVPSGFAPAPSDVVSYVQLSNGSVLVQLANQQSLLVTSNNFFIDGSGVLYLSPSVSSGISGGGAAVSSAMTATTGFPTPSAPIGTTNLGQTSSGVIFDDVSAAASSGGILGTITGGPGLFGLGTIGTVAAIGLGGGAILLAANAIRAQLSDDDDAATGNQAASVAVMDDDVEVGETDGTLTYAITDQDGIDESDLIASLEAGLDGASTIASVFPNGATVSTERTGSGLVDGTEDTYRSINVTLTGDISGSLNVGEFTGPSVSFTDAAGNDETVNLALNITSGTAGTTGNTGSTGNTGTSSLELNAADGGTYTIPQGGTYLFRATDSEGDTVSYEIDNNPTGVGIDSNTGLVTVASSVATGNHTITVTATSTNSDGSVDTDTETYNIEVTSNGSTSPTNTVDADFDSTGAGFSTLNGQNITDSSLATNDDDEFEVPNATDLANSYVIDGLAGADTLYFSEFGATYHLDPTDQNSFEDVAGFETLTLLSGVDLEINGGVLDSSSTGDIEYIQGTTENRVTLVNTDADMGLDVSLTGIETIDMNNYDLTLDYADLAGVDMIEGDTESVLVFTGQFTYDFADAMIDTTDVVRLGIDAGNYDYSLTLDGIHDEDVTQIYAYGENQIEGDVMIDTRENAKVTLIDLAGDQYTTGGLSGSSNIFATYDDELTILGGDNDDDVDLTLDSDVEDGELHIDLGDDAQDTLNINLNGDEIDTRGFGRHIDHVEYVNVDAPQGDGEAHLQFNGSSEDVSTLRVLDMSDLSEDGGIYLAGDLSQTSGYRADTVSSIGFVADISSFEFANIASTAPLAGDTSAGTFQELLMIDGYVSDDDLEITMTPGDDVIEMIIGESEYLVTLSASGTQYTQEVNAAATTFTVPQLSMRNIANLGNGNQSFLSTTAATTLGGSVDGVTLTNTIAEGAGEVDLELGGGDDQISLVLGSAQTSNVTLHVARADADDFDTIDFDVLEDMGVQADAHANSATGNAYYNVQGLGNASGLEIDFQDDVTQILTDVSAIDSGSIDVANSTQGTVIVYGMNTNSVQKGLLYDYDGDGQLSDGDTVIDLTDALLAQGQAAGAAFGSVGIWIDTDGDATITGDTATELYASNASIINATPQSIGMITDGLDYIEFALSGGDLVDVA